MADIKVISGPAKQGKREPLQGVKHKIMVMSGKGGVGKSTVAANIAVGLVQRGHAVGLLDADVHGPSIPRLLGATEERLMMSGDRIQPAEVLPRLKVMSIAYFLEEKDAPVVWRGPVKMGALRQFIEDVDWGELDYLIVDLPPGTGDEPLSIAQLVPKADGAVIVTTPEVSAVRDADRITGLLEASGFSKPELIINRLKPKMVARGDMMDIPDILDILAIDLVGVVPDDEYIVVSTNRGEPAVLQESSRAGQAYRNIARRLMGEQVPFMDLTEKESVWEKIKRMVKLG